MPYSIRKVKDDVYRVKNKETGRVISKGTTKTKAERQVRLLNALEHGYVPTKRNI
jgi:hypothetical protein